MTIRDSEIFQDKIEPVNKKWIQDYKGFRNTMKQYGERDTKGVEHARWIDVDPNVTNRYTAFAIVRNPWSKVVSRFLFAKQAIERGHVKESYADTRSLEHFIQGRYDWGLKPLTWYRAIRGWWPQKHHVKDNEGNVVCDILTLENLNIEAPKYLGVDSMPRARNVTSIKQDYKELFDTKTCQIFIAGGNDKAWRKLCDEVGRPELGKDPRFLTNSDRQNNKAELKAEL